MKLKIKGQAATWIDEHLTVSGSDGVYTLEIETEDDAELNATWGELAKFAVYKNTALEDKYPEGVYAEIQDGEAQIPACILTEPGLLCVGIIGQNGYVTMPTIYAPPVRIALGCGEGEAAAPSVMSAAQNAIIYGENAKVYAEGGHIVTGIGGPIGDPDFDRLPIYTKGAKDYALDAQEASGDAEAAAADAVRAKEAAEAAQTAAETAQGKAEDAQTAAETAQGKAEDAQTAAETAKGKAEDAQTAAETAQGKAEDAQTAAETAQGKAEDAQTAAETAQGKAEDAQTAAETAQGKAEDAEENAEAWAVGERGGVPVTSGDPTYENNAKYYAQQAEELAPVLDFAYIQNKAGKTVIGLYADSEEQTGDVVSFSDGADNVPLKKLEAQVNPMQDLHGYANPWPAGGGKNKFDKTAATTINGYISVSQSKIVAGSDYRTVYIPCDPSTTYTVQRQTSAGETNLALTVGFAKATPNTTNPLYGCATSSASAAGQKASVSITTDAEALYLCIFVGEAAFFDTTIDTVQVELGETATDYAPYANVCPISGWTGAKIHHYGLPAGYVEADYLRLQDTKVEIPISLARNDAIVTTQFRYNGRKQYAFVYSQYQSEAKDCTRLIQTENEFSDSFYLNNNSKASIPHALSITANVWHTLISARTMCSLDGDVVSLSPTAGTANTATTLQIGNGNTTTGVTQDFRQFDINSGAGPLLSLIPCTDPNGDVGFYDAVSDTFYAAADQSKATAVDTPANIVKRIGNVLTVSWSDEAGTVYGGTLEYLGGEKWRLTLDHKVKVFDGTETPAYLTPYANPNGGYNMWFQYVGCGMDDCKMVVGDSPKRSDRFSYTPRQLINQNTIPIWSISGNVRSADGYIFFSFPLEYDTNAKILAWFAANNTQVWYALATPLVYDLTADQVKTLPGNNVIFADTGNVTVIHRSSQDAKAIPLEIDLAGVLKVTDGALGAVDTDTAVTEDSANLITSGAVYDAINA